MLRIARQRVLAAALFLAAGCEGPAGPPGPAGESGQDGENGADGRNGWEGAMGVTGSVGAPGAAGAAGTSGANGAVGMNGQNGSNAALLDASIQDATLTPDARIEPRYDCKWCTPSSYTSCAPDGKTLQRCVDDGDGCGHWEVAKTCSGRCGFFFSTTEKDSLGNGGQLRQGCDSDATLDCRYVANLCGARQTCSTKGTCEPSPNWTSATATLRTGFDGVVHEFTSIGGSAFVSCTGGTSTDYWNNGTTRSCSLNLSSVNWTASAAGPTYAGTPISHVSVGKTPLLASAGTTTAQCSVSLDANRFTPGTSACSLNITAASLEPGGVVEGTFTYVLRLTGHNETVNASTLSVSGEFKATAPGAL